MRVLDTNNYTLIGMAVGDYGFGELNDGLYIIDRSDSMETDYVRVATEPKVTIIKGHKLRVQSWVQTYDKFLNELF